MARILLIDGNSLFFRAYYGSARTSTGVLTTSFGQATNGLVTFNNMFYSMIRKYQPSHILCAFDTKDKTRRHEKYEAYKAGRPPLPKELATQFAPLYEMVELMGVKQFKLSGFEADDIIGTLAKKYDSDENEVLILSSDKDLYQLVSKNVMIISPQGAYKDDKIVTIDNFKDIMGINPDQVVDYKGIVGDTSDNLPGVRGVGDKGAVKLLNEYGDLETVYKNLDKMTPKMKEKFEAANEISFACKDLATLIYDVEVPHTLEDMTFLNVVTQDLIDYYKKYEMNSLVKRYEKMVEKTEENSLENIEF